VFNFISIFFALFVRTLFWQLFLRTRNVHVTRKKAAETTFVQKNAQKTLMSYVPALASKFRTKNARVKVDEIDTRLPKILCLHSLHTVCRRKTYF